MSIRDLTWRPELVQPRVITWQVMKRRLLRRRSTMQKYFRSQYYLHYALKDGLRAFQLNEDIALCGLLIIATLSFATISIFSNILYYFLMAAGVISGISGTSVAFWVAASVAVPLILGFWVAAFMQNILMQALYEGSTHKRYRSLRQTIVKSLRFTSRTAMAWIGLLIYSLLPMFLCFIVSLGIVKIFNVGLGDIAPYVIVSEGLAFIWFLWVLVNYSLLPQVMLFISPSSWQLAVRQAKELVSRKGRILVLSAYIVFMISLVIVYGIAMAIDAVAQTGVLLDFLLLCMVPVSLMNATFTMLYRKRRLARS